MLASLHQSVIVSSTLRKINQQSCNMPNTSLLNFDDGSSAAPCVDVPWRRDRRGSRRRSEAGELPSQCWRLSLPGSWASDSATNAPASSCRSPAASVMTALREGNKGALQKRGTSSIWSGQLRLTEPRHSRRQSAAELRLLPMILFLYKTFVKHIGRRTRIFFCCCWFFLLLFFNEEALAKRPK